MSELRTNRIIPRDGLTSGTFNGGGVIQVKHTAFTGTDDATGAIATALTDFESTYNCVITPTRSDSKILITVAQLLRTHCTDSSLESAGGGIRLLRGSTVIVNARDHGAVDGSGTYGSRDFSVNADLGAANLALVGTKSIIFLDSPNTTSSLTYKTQGRIMNTNMTLQMNPTDTVNNQPSIMILQEVSA